LLRRAGYQAAQESLNSFCSIMPPEVIGTQVLEGDTVAQREKDGRKYGGCGREDGFFGTRQIERYGSDFTSST
jgi:hypothetical protein